MSEAENAFLHVHLYLCSWNHGHKIMRKFLGQPFGCKIWTVQEPELTEKMLRKSLFQDCWLKDIVYQEWVLKDKLDKHYAWCVACEIQLKFIRFMGCIGNVAVYDYYNQRSLSLDRKTEPLSSVASKQAEGWLYLSTHTVYQYKIL